jgi:hypothetical protein
MQVWAERMRAQFEGIKRKHRGESGRRREDDVREFLRAFLPDRLGIGTGEIAAADGTVSPQVDLIVYDRLKTPLLDRSESSIVVPVEGVYGVIEVASQLTVSKLREDLEKIRQVKSLPKIAYWKQENPVIVNSYSPHGIDQDRWPILGFCFGYSGGELVGLRADLRSSDDEDVTQNLDMLCVLDKGCIANGHVDEQGRVSKLWGAPSPGSQRVLLPNRDAGPGEGLMFFYLLAGGILMQADTSNLNMARYLGRSVKPPS